MSVARAIALYESFFGRAPEVDEVVTIRCRETPGIVIGRVVSVVYLPTQGSRPLEHEFAERSQPFLAVNDDGNQIFFLQGNYKFTGRGFKG